MTERPRISKSGKVRIPVKRPGGSSNYIRNFAVPAMVFGGVAAYAVAQAPFQRFSEVIALSKLFGNNNTPPPPSTGSGTEGAEGIGNFDIGPVEMVIATLAITALVAFALARRGSQVA